MTPIEFKGGPVYELGLTNGNSITGKVLRIIFDAEGDARLVLEQHGGSVVSIGVNEVKLPVRPLGPLEMLGWAAG